MSVSITRIVKFIRKGEKGNGLITAVTYLRKYTLAEWKNYGAVGKQNNWTNISNASDMNVGDTIVINGVVTDKENISISLYATIIAITGTTVIANSTTLIMAGERGIQGLQGLQGPRGEQGLPGTDGNNGKTSYFHIKYSAVANPTVSSQMSETPNTYIGTYVDFTKEDSTDPKKYTWHRFEGLQGPKGEQGIPGVGTDGKTTYLHIKYSNDGGKTFTANNGETVGDYIGFCTDFSETDPTSVSSYTWSKIKGEQGRPGEDGKDGTDGVDGEDGNGIKSQTSLFVASNRSTGVTHDNTTGWQSAFIAPTQQKPYIWKCVQTIYTKTSTTYSTAELVAIWQNGANANLLDNAAFTDDTNLGAWETISEYAAADGQTAPTPEIGKVNKTETVEGRNSFYDTCKYLGSRINFKEVLRQVVHNQMAGKPLKLVGNNWYTFSFWAKGWQQTISVRQNSSAYGFAKKELYLIAGRTYAISAYGYIDTAAQNEGKTLAIYVYNDGWSESKSMEITKTSYEQKTMEFTPQTTGVYHLEAYMYDDTRPSTGSVYLSSYKVEDNCDLNTYIYPSVVDTDTKVFIDGVETRPDPDLGVTWKLGSSWTKHTVSFKTKWTLAYADIQGVLFRLMPTPCEEAYRNIYICMPKLEIGMMATGFIDNASDTKGDRGPALRGPQAWSDCAVGYVFQSGASGEEYKDVVLYGNNYYSCIKSHTKTASNNPGSATDTNSGLWKLADKLEMVATKILLAQYALVKNLGVEAIDMKDAEGNIIFQAKDGNVTCNSGTFNNIKVTGNSEFSGTMKAVSGSFKSLDCVDVSGKVVGNIAFGSDGRMWFDGDMYSQGYRNDKQRNNRFYASDILCRGMFGHREKITAVVKGSYMYVYSKGADQSGTYVSLKTGKTSDNKTFYYIPLYSPSDADDISGLPIDVVVFNTSLDYYYAFSGMNNGKEWRVINGNDKQTVHFCDIAGWHSLGGGASVNCIYVNPEWLNPVPGASGIGRGVFWTGETDLNW